MPMMDGHEATQKIRQMGYRKGIIGYTAYSHGNDVQTCIDVGMNVVLNKPALPTKILETIEQLVR